MARSSSSPSITPDAVLADPAVREPVTGGLRDDVALLAVHLADGRAVSR